MTHGFSYGEISSFGAWFKKQPHKYKVWTAGNHDRLIEMLPSLASMVGPEYLCDSGITIEGIRFWGSPYTPWFNNWAFNEHKDNMWRHWDLIPADTDILITHGPAYGIRDSLYIVNSGQEHLGDQHLLEVVYRVRPKHHIFGHIHFGFGLHKESGMEFHNVSVCDEAYKLANPCTVIDL